MVIVVGLGSIVGLFLSRRIGMTFNNLAAAATAFQQGDLDTPVQIETDLDEATSVAQALESARQALNTSLLNLRREKEWSDHLLDSIVEGIVILDQENRIRFFSPGAERISGWSREDVLMQPCDLFFQPLEVEELISSLLPRTGSQTTLDVEMAGGRRSSLAISAATFTPTGSDVSQTLLLFRDVSEEQVIHRLMGHFMANISHEFRTPLSAIAASTELLIDQVEDLSIGELHELLSALHLGILKLSTLVDNLIESASIETGHFRVTPRQVDLGQIIGEAVETMQPLLDKYRQKLDIELPIAIPMAYADPRRTVQVLTNLLSNASKFGPAGSTIRIVTKVKDGLIRVEVQDRGPGVAQEYQDFIFRRFATVPQEVSQGGYGIGLGLSVVKAIVEAGGGEVGVSQNPQGGAIFWFTLPEVQKL
jgi:PAS domain S-box-containing protein